jgi:hypothetical protein
LVDFSLLIIFIGITLLREGIESCKYFYELASSVFRTSSITVKMEAEDSSEEFIRNLSASHSTLRERLIARLFLVQ